MMYKLAGMLLVGLAAALWTTVIIAAAHSTLTWFYVLGSVVVALALFVAIIRLRFARSWIFFDAWLQEHKTCVATTALSSAWLAGAAWIDPWTSAAALAVSVPTFAWGSWILNCWRRRVDEFMPFV